MRFDDEDDDDFRSSKKKKKNHERGKRDNFFDNSFSNDLDFPVPKRDFGERSFGDKPPRREFNDRNGGQRSFGDRNFSDRNSSGDRSNNGGSRPPRREYGDRSNNRNFGDRNNNRSYGDRNQGGERSYGGGERNFGDRNFGDRPPRRDFGNKKFGDKPFRNDSPREDLPVVEGIVKFYNGERGFGFVSPNGGGEDVFIHISALQRAGIEKLEPNQKVSFQLLPDKFGKGPKAINIKLLEE